MPRHDRTQLQRQHENYWGKRWAVALGRHVGAQVQSDRPSQDPPDVCFGIRRDDGTESETWGEVTGVYYDGDEAEWMWGTGIEDQRGKTYWEPDAVVAARAAELVAHKRSKYSELVSKQGGGHLLVVLNHPMTTQLTRVKAEKAIREMLRGETAESGPFETVWLGYRLGYMAEDEQYVFQDDERRNFMKCVWTRPISP